MKEKFSKLSSLTILRVIYRFFAFLFSILLWFGFIFSITVSLFTTMIGAGATIVGLLIYAIAYIPIANVISKFAYNGIRKRAIKLKDEFVWRHRNNENKSDKNNADKA